MPEMGQFVEQILGTKGEVITSLAFHHIGWKKRLDGHFWTFWTHWSRFYKHLSLTNTDFYTFDHNREPQAIGS